MKSHERNLYHADELRQRPTLSNTSYKWGTGWWVAVEFGSGDKKELRSEARERRTWVNTVSELRTGGNLLIRHCFLLLLTREDDELSVDTKRRKTMDFIYERERRKTQCRLPKPEPNAEYQYRAVLLAMGAGEADRGKRGRQGQARPTGASEAGGGRRDWWGQTRPMGAVSRRAKSLVNSTVSGTLIPSGL